MEAVFLAFITGLTTGGLSCLAVQGGLLATSLAQQIESDLGKAMPLRSRPRPAAKIVRQPAGAGAQTALPIALFLLAKLAAYTLLGALLGQLGSYLTLSPLWRAILMIVIGVFMIGNALRMLNVHPFFRIFNLEPPKFVTRFIRRTAKGAQPGSAAKPDWVTPTFLGFLTVLIPCGVTQAMMATALGSGSALQGATLMFAFTLGTSPVFFAVAYLATRLGAKLERFFMTFVALAVLILGLVTLNSGLNLAGSPLSFNNLTRSLSAPAEGAPAALPSGTAAAGVIRLLVQNDGYSPQALHAPAEQALTLELVTQNTVSCARDFVIPALDVYELLPTNGPRAVQIPPQARGSTLAFTCSMGMYTGQIIFDQ